MIEAPKLKPIISFCEQTQRINKPSQLAIDNIIYELANSFLTASQDRKCIRAMTTPYVLGGVQLSTSKKATTMYNREIAKT